MNNGLFELIILLAFTSAYIIYRCINDYHNA